MGGLEPRSPRNVMRKPRAGSRRSSRATPIASMPSSASGRRGRGWAGGGVRLSATAVLLVSPLRPLLHDAERAPGLLLNGSLPTPETTAMFLNASHPGRPDDDGLAPWPERGA